MSKPHVVILGAGASQAAFPNGEYPALVGKRLSNDQWLIIPVGHHLVAYGSSAERAGVIVFFTVA
jgi:hypothetical protein